jgi:hypothetical protein
MRDAGSSTATANGHVYATDTFVCGENTGATATSSQRFGNSGGSTIDLGAAFDTYADTDSGTITTSDTQTTPWDSFNLSDSHSISGSMYESGSSGGASVIVNDNGVRLRRIDGLTAYGTSATYGSSFHFDNWQSASDDFVLTKNAPNQYNGICTDISQSTDVTTGTSSLGQSGSAYSYSVSDTVSTAININGSNTYGTVATGIPWGSHPRLYDIARRWRALDWPAGDESLADEHLSEAVAGRGQHQRPRGDPARAVMCEGRQSRSCACLPSRDSSQACRPRRGRAEPRP